VSGTAVPAALTLTLQDGSRHAIVRAQDVADALRGWGREPGSHATLAGAGAVLQAAGDIAQGFQLRLLSGAASPLRSERAALSRAEALRRLQAFATTPGETGPRAGWRRGRRWRSESDIAARVPRSPWAYWRRWLLLLLALQVVPGVFTGVGLWQQERIDRFMDGAVRHEARVVSNEPESSQSSWRRVTLHRLDGQGAYVHISRKSRLARAQVGDADAIWVAQDGRWKTDSSLCLHCGYGLAGMGLLFHALTLMGLCFQGWQDRFRRPAPDRFAALDAASQRSGTMAA
jgi:hypothetical protein